MGVSILMIRSPGQRGTYCTDAPLFTLYTAVFLYLIYSITAMKELLNTMTMLHAQYDALSRLRIENYRQLLARFEKLGSL